MKVTFSLPSRRMKLTNPAAAASVEIELEKLDQERRLVLTGTFIRVADGKPIVVPPCTHPRGHAHSLGPHLHLRVVRDDGEEISEEEARAVIRAKEQDILAAYVAQGSLGFAECLKRIEKITTRELTSHPMMI